MTNYIIDERKLLGEHDDGRKAVPNRQNTGREEAVPPGEIESAVPSQPHTHTPLSQSAGCWTAMFWLSVVYWGISILCCCSMMVCGWWMGESVRQGISENPVVIREQTQMYFGNIDIPPIFKPAMAMTFKQPFSGKPVFFGAVYTYTNPGKDQAISDVITVGTFSDYLAEELRNTFQQRLTTDITLDNTTRTVLEERTVPVQILGKPYDFQLLLTEDKQGNRLMTISGLFRNSWDRPAFILVSVDPQTISRKQVELMIDSISPQ